MSTFLVLKCQLISTNISQNEDVGNFQGWDLITRRMKDGRQILKEYSEFLKQRYGALVINKYFK